MSDPLTGRTLVIATGHDLSLAVLEGGHVLAELTLPMSRGHAEALVPEIARLLEALGGPDAGCSHLLVETGPGSFTGLRVGLAAARALAFAWGASLHGVRSTQLVAAAARATAPDGRLFVALAAPRGQVWVEGFELPSLASCGEPLAVSADQARAMGADFDRIAGSVAFGVDAGPPRAAAAVGLALADLDGAELLYVRAADMVAAA